MSGREDDDEGGRGGEEGLVEPEGRGNGGLAGLPAAVEEHVAFFRVEEFVLPWIDGEATVAQELRGVEGGKQLSGVHARESDVRRWNEGRGRQLTKKASVT